jgi:hypothetical protein
MSQHNFIAMNFENEREVEVKLNLTPEELKTKHEGLKPEINSTTWLVLKKSLYLAISSLLEEQRQ